jgi:hypothetical protein
MMNETNVHGSIFYLLKKFVVSLYSEDVWKQFLVASGKDADFEFTITESYPLADIDRIVAAASQHSGHSVHQLQEIFGEWLVPDLFKVYSTYLRRDWRTWEVLVNTEQVMHGAVRKLNSTANPPVLHVSEIVGNQLTIDYKSQRKMGSLAVGIIRGIAKYYEEENDITITPATDPDAETVKINIIFHNR